MNEWRINGTRGIKVVWSTRGFSLLGEQAVTGVKEGGVWAGFLRSRLGRAWSWVCVFSRCERRVKKGLFVYY